MSNKVRYIHIYDKNNGEYLIKYKNNKLNALPIFINLDTGKKKDYDAVGQYSLGGLTDIDDASDYMKNVSDIIRDEGDDTYDSFEECINQECETPEFKKGDDL